MDRRSFLHFGVGSAIGLTVRQGLAAESAQESTAPQSAHSVAPVVGDGNWVWKVPPKDRTGYLDPRTYELKIGIRLEGTGPARAIKATTTAPVKLPGQEIDYATIENEGCLAELRKLAPEAGQLIMTAPSIRKGQTITATAVYRVTLHKEYHAYHRDQFPAVQEFPVDFRKLYLHDSPGIQTRIPEVRDLAAQVVGSTKHPWDKARAYHRWVWENIRARIGTYTSVVAAIRDRVGDCEERAAVFAALCRAAGIPARLVWVPNHNWAEFCMRDKDGRGYWIPAHTSCYNWFGWTGAHELVLQKGDSIQVPEKHEPYRLLEDWMQWMGSRPKVQYLAELQPLAAEPAADPGPGARRKNEKGEWVVQSKHKLDRFLRDGSRAAEG